MSSSTREGARAKTAAGARLREAIALMTAFAARTGVRGDGPSTRYLWTDAFATCTFLGMTHATGDGEYTELALGLVDRVHRVLGRGSEAHPTCAGLRIGKRLPERRADEPFDERLEWERDGQYFHYLTKWMHALDQVTRSTGDPTFTRWASELARAAHRAFVYEPRPGAGKRMYWKMSVDLSRPLVASMGQHDPLDGFVTCLQLEASAAAQGGAVAADLVQARADFRAMIDPRALATDDPLGLGGMLVDAYRVAQLRAQSPRIEDDGLLDALLVAACEGLRHYAAGPALRMPAARRLAFREIGLSIGLAAAQAMEAAASRVPGSFSGGPLAGRALEALGAYARLRAEIETFWLRPEHRSVETWCDHLDINEVMLATSLAPEGFLVLRPPS